MAEKLQITKLEAARRHLQTAIELWFFDKDAVSIHTLAYAAYEVVHVISKKKKRLIELLFDSLFIKDEYRSEFNITLKKHANFFKHADRNSEDTIDFPPQISESFMMFTILGLESMKELLNDSELAFVWWLYINKPQFLTQSGSKFVADSVPVEYQNMLRGLSKADFYDTFIEAKKQLHITENRKKECPLT